MIFNRFQPRAAATPAVWGLLSLLPIGHAWSADAPPADVVRSPATDAALAYRFTPADEELLEAAQRGCFHYMWKEVGQPSGLAMDRRTADLVSTAGVGFQLSALPIGVEHGWITREEGAARANSILRALIERTDNKHAGVYLHFVNPADGGLPPGKIIDQASTVDHALLLAGALPAATYFGGDVAKLVDRMAADTNWRLYDNSAQGFISFGWLPNDGRSMDGPGEFRPWDWHFSTDEEHIVYFLAAGAPREDFAVDPSDYYRLERTIKGYADMPPHVVSWNGALFTYFFSHCWIDYRRYEEDDPRLFGVENPRVDWIENSRRAVLTHRRRCREMGGQFPTLAGDRWGLSPCTGLNEQRRPSYLVQDVQPNICNNDKFWQGTVAPYAAGASLMFAPAEAMEALHSMRLLIGKDGKPLAWRDPAEGGYGFVDSFNIEQQHGSDDYVAIDVGPMLLAMENARTGLIWRLFMDHPVARRAVERLKWVARKGS